MATLTLRQLWINLVATGEGVSYPTVGRSVTRELGGEIQDYAGGRQRFIGNSSDRGQFQVTLRRLTLTQVLALETWRGQVVLVRDHRGQGFYGVFPGLDRVEHKIATLYDATITLQFVTADEGV